MTAHWLTPQNRVLRLSAPEKEGVVVPTEEDLQGIFTTVAQQELAPYQEAVSDDPLLAQLPKPGPVVEERHIEELDVTEWQLSNGIRVILKPTDFKNDEVLFSSYSPGGSSLVPDDAYLSAVWSDNLIRESGLGQFSKIDVEKKLADKVVSVSPSLGELSEAITGSASPQDLETMFQLIYLTFTAPRLDDAAISAYLARTRERIKNRLSDPMSVFRDTIWTTMSQGHFRTRPMTEEMLDDIQPAAALEIYQDRFADAGDFTFFFVGNFDLDGIKPLIEWYLGGLPDIPRQDTWKDVGIDPPEGVIEKRVEKGVDPKSVVVLMFTGEYAWSRQTNYDLNAMVDALQIRLREVIREELGGTYGVGVSADLSRVPDQEYAITINFSCDPERVDELTDAVVQEITTLQTTPLDETYITRVKQTNLRTYETNLEKNDYWLNALRSAYYHEQDPVDVIAGYPQFVESTSAVRIQQTAQTYFDMNNYAKFVLYPEQQKNSEK